MARAKSSRPLPLWKILSSLPPKQLKNRGSVGAQLARLQSENEQLKARLVEIETRLRE